MPYLVLFHASQYVGMFVRVFLPGGVEGHEGMFPPLRKHQRGGSANPEPKKPSHQTAILRIFYQTGHRLPYVRAHGLYTEAGRWG